MSGKPPEEVSTIIRRDGVGAITCLNEINGCNHRWIPWKCGDNTTFDACPICHLTRIQTPIGYVYGTEDPYLPGFDAEAKGMSAEELSMIIRELGDKAHPRYFRCLYLRQQYPYKRLP